MIASSRLGGHSAQVTMRLPVNGSSLRIAKMGPDFLLLDDPVNLPPGNASILLQVDQSKRRWDVHLPDGISAASKRVAIGKAG